MKKATTPEVIPTVAGTPFAGGYYVGRFFVGADAYALVVSPVVDDFDPVGWNKTTKKVAGALSYNDGLANTEAMAAAGSAIAKKISALDTGGHSDWYLPSRLETLLLYGECEALKGNADSAMAEDWYWTSTQYAHNGAYAWIQSFRDGGQSYGHKGYHDRARAVRRVKI